MTVPPGPGLLACGLQVGVDDGGQEAVAVEQVAAEVDWLSGRTFPSLCNDFSADNDVQGLDYTLALEHR
ncbi:hypothetical protein [Longispora urticae]